MTSHSGRLPITLAVLSLLMARPSHAIEFSIKPIRADVAHTFKNGVLHILDHPARVELEVFVADWDRNRDGVPVLKTFQFEVDRGSLKSGPIGHLLIPQAPCLSHGDCAAMGPAPECRITQPGQPGTCEQASQDITRDDWIHACCQAIPACRGSDLTCGSTTLGSGAVDNGSPKYLGTIWIDVPGTAAGPFSVQLNTSALPWPVTFLEFEPSDATDEALLELSNVPARIVVEHPTACCMPDNSCQDVLFSECSEQGGATVLGTLCGPESAEAGAHPICTQDCQPNGIWDPAELAGTPFLDCNSNLILDVCESDTTVNVMVDRFPSEGQTMPRRVGPIVRLEFTCPIPLPSAAQISFRQLLPGGSLGPNLIGSHVLPFPLFPVDPVHDPGGPFRGLRFTAIQEFQQATWYRVEVPSPFGGLPPLQFDLPVLIGDVDNDGFVLNRDVLLANAGPFGPVTPTDRRDLNGNGSLSNADVVGINAMVPRRMPPKPSGH